MRKTTIEDINKVIEKLVETTTTANIGVVNMPFAVGRKSDIKKNDPALGGRNKFQKKQLSYALRTLLSM